MESQNNQIGISKLAFTDFLAERKSLIDSYLEGNLKSNSSQRLIDAMRYSCLNGGKRIRGILSLTTFEAISLKRQKHCDFDLVLPIAAGIECIHSMSLIHDDLPCMDNDDFRRGKLTCHKQYNEATALLAGDALLIDGIGLCLKAKIEESRLIKIINLIIKAIGSCGMTAGQMLDLEKTDKDILLEDLETIHNLKTGKFISASVISGAIAADANDEELTALGKYSEKIGLAFQVTDDLLDLEGDIFVLGKTPGKDLKQNKATYPKLIGIHGAKDLAKKLISEAKGLLEQLEEAPQLPKGEAEIHPSTLRFKPLCDLAEYIIQRIN